MYRDDAMASTRSKSAAQATIDRWRADTPGCTERVHLNNAGAALVPSSVATPVAGHLALESTLGGYEAAESVADQLQDVYASLATLLGAEPRNVAVAPNSTVAFSIRFCEHRLAMRPISLVLLLVDEEVHVPPLDADHGCPFHAASFVPVYPRRTWGGRARSPGPGCGTNGPGEARGSAADSTCARPKPGTGARAGSP